MKLVMVLILVMLLTSAPINNVKVTALSNNQYPIPAITWEQSDDSTVMLYKINQHGHYIFLNSVDGAPHNRYVVCTPCDSAYINMPDDKYYIIHNNIHYGPYTLYYEVILPYVVN